MPDYTQEQIDKALKEVEAMDHLTMARLWRFGTGPDNTEIYFRNDYPVVHAFKKRFFEKLGGFTPEISKQLGWK